MNGAALRRNAAIGGVLGPAAFVGAWVVGALTTDAEYSMIDDPISRLAAVGAPTRALMTAGFVGFGLGVSAFAWSLRRHLAGRAWLAALGAAGATLLVATAPLDRSEFVDRLHGAFAGTGYVALAATPLLAAPHLVAAGHRGVAAAGTVAGLVSAASLAASLTGLPTGLFQRVGLTATDSWIMATAALVLLGRVTSSPDPV